MRLKIQHITHYSYSDSVTDNHNEVRLAPINNSRQSRLSFSLKTSPQSKLFHYELTGGIVHHFNIRAPHKHLMVAATSVVATEPVDPFQDMIFAEDDFFFYDSDEIRENFAEYLAASKFAPSGLDVREFVEMARANAAGPGVSHFLLSLNRVLNSSLNYEQGVTNVETSVQELLITRKGVCQDFAHLMIAISRSLGIPARYVSGYLYTRPSAPRDVAPLKDQEAGGDREALSAQIATAIDLIDGGAMHAWVECLQTSGQWVAFDPTNKLVADERYVVVHYGRDYADALPMRGVYAGPQNAKMNVSVKVDIDE